jgi:hypothetical protein
MRLSHRMLTFALLLVSGLMTFSEAPEILTLADDTSNDCEWVQIAPQSRPKCNVKDSTGQATPGQVQVNRFAGAREASVRGFLSSPSSRSTRSLLLLLVPQRK